VAKVSTETQGRAPTPESWRLWTGYYRDRACNAETLKALGRAAYTSPAFFELGYDNAAKLLALYRGALNREPLRSDVGFFLPLLSNGSLTWTDAVDAVLASPEFGNLATSICDPADPDYSFSPIAAGDLRQWAYGSPSRTQRQLQLALDAAQPICGTVVLAPKEVVPIGGDQPGAGPDNEGLRIPPCVTLSTAGSPDPHRYADMGRLVPKGLVCGSSSCGHAEVVRVGNGARLENVWVDGHGTDPRNLKLALVGAGSGQAETAIANNRLTDPPPGGVAVRAEGYGTSATPCSGRVISGNLITGYATRHAQTRLGRPLWAGGISVFCEQATVRGNELVDVSDTGIVVHGIWNAATEELRTQRSTVSNNRVVSAGISAHVALGADAVGECLADRDGPPVDCIEFSHDRGSARAERSFTETSVSGNTFWTGARTHFDIALLVGSKSIWGDNGPQGRGASFTDNTTAGVDSTRVNTGIAVSGMFEADVRGNTGVFDVADTNPTVSDGKCPRGDVLYGLSLASFAAGSQPAAGVSGLDGCLVDHPPPGGMERIEVGPGRTFVGRESGERFVPWGQNQGLDHQVDVFDLREIKQMGSNVVRIHLQFKDIMADCTSARPAALAELGDTLRRAEENGIYLDLTGLASYSGDDQDPACYRNATEEGRWSAQEAFWRAVAQRVAGSPAVFALNIANEPIVPASRTPCWAGPAPPEQPGASNCPGSFGGHYFPQNITREPNGRPDAEIGRAWIRRMRDAIRVHDREHLITLGCSPFTRCVGLNGPALASALDYLSVHVYPRDCTPAPPAGKDPCLDERSMENGSGNPLTYELDLVAAYASGGDPVVVEETFPLRGSPELVRRFILASRAHVTGWVGQWGDLTMSQIRADPAGFPWLAYFWGRVFQRLTGYLYLPDHGRGGRPERDGGGGAVPDGPNADAPPLGSPAGAVGGARRAIVDRTAPTLRSLRVSPRRFAVMRRTSRALRRGARRRPTIRYRLSEAATVVLAVERRSPRRRTARRCGGSIRKHRSSRRCFRFKRVTRFSVKGREGRNRTRFPARLSRTRRLRAGRYRVVARAIDRAGNRSKRKRAHFRVLASR
jgi:hypothetical protein